MPPESTIFPLLRSALFGTPLALPERVDWREVHREMQRIQFWS